MPPPTTVAQRSERAKCLRERGATAMGMASFRWRFDSFITAGRKFVFAKGSTDVAAKMIGRATREVHVFFDIDWMTAAASDKFKNEVGTQPTPRMEVARECAVGARPIIAGF